MVFIQLKYLITTSIHFWYSFSIHSQYQINIVLSIQLFTPNSDHRQTSLKDKYRIVAAARWITSDR